MAKKNIQKSAVFGAYLLLVALLTTGFSQAQVPDRDSGLINYYLQSARNFIESSDLRGFPQEFTAVAVVRVYTLDKNSDTLSMDTAIMRAYFSPVANDSESMWGPLPDSVLTLRDSFVGEVPALTSFIVSYPWEREGEFRLYPDDPTQDGQAIEHYRIDTDADSSQSALFEINKSTGALEYELYHVSSDNDRRRYTRETEYQIVSGYLSPMRIVEHMTERSFFGSKHVIVETEVVALSFE